MVQPIDSYLLYLVNWYHLLVSRNPVTPSDFPACAIRVEYTVPVYYQTFTHWKINDKTFLQNLQRHTDASHVITSCGSLFLDCQFRTDACHIAAAMMVITPPGDALHSNLLLCF